MVTARNTVNCKNEHKCIADVASSHLARRKLVGNIDKQINDPNLIKQLSRDKEESMAFSKYRDMIIWLGK